MLIRELEQKTGLERATIRFYEKEGFITPQRADNGYRTYSDDDCETLLKIKLLRQLGMPLEKIRALQQGSEEFTNVLNEQIAALEKQIRDSVRAKEVCIEIRDNAIDYATLDARYYLDALTRPSTADTPKWEPRTVPEFHRVTPVHPWKRFFARTLDLAILDLVLLFFISVVFRVRPVNGFVYTVLELSIVSHLLWIPIEGLLLHYFGTTPGKWIFGIRVESVNGGNLTVSAAMTRCWNVLRYGYGFTIPFYGLWRMYKSYREYTAEAQTCWDLELDSELQFDYFYDLPKKAAIGLTVAAMILCFGWTTNDRIKPVHRGEDLTVAQIAENYNDLVEMMANENGETPSPTALLDAEGKWGTVTSTQPSGGAVVIIGTNLTSNYPGPEFVIENGAVRKIIYRASYEDIMMLQIFGARPFYLALSAALAQDWMSVLCYEDFAEKLSNAVKAENGIFTYENIEIVWQTETENCIYSGSCYYAKNTDKPSSVDVTIEIRIHETK